MQEEGDLIQHPLVGMRGLHNNGIGVFFYPRFFRLGETFPRKNDDGKVFRVIVVDNEWWGWWAVLSLVTRFDLI